MHFHDCFMEHILRFYSMCQKQNRQKLPSPPTKLSECHAMQAQLLFDMDQVTHPAPNPEKRTVQMNNMDYSSRIVNHVLLLEDIDPHPHLSKGLLLQRSNRKSLGEHSLHRYQLRFRWRAICSNGSTVLSASIDFRTCNTIPNSHAI